MPAAWYIVALLVAVVAVILGFVLPYAARRLEEARLRTLARERRAVVLTFDDGPSELTRELLELLGEFHAHATFFMLGRRAGTLPGVVDLVVEAGHEVGTHSENHLNGWKSWPWRVVADVRGGIQTLVRRVPDLRLFRPPFGKPTLWGNLAARAARCRPAWWTVDSGDTFGVLPDPRDVVDRVISDGGGVVLLHDLRRSKERDEYVLTLTRTLLARAREAQIAVLTYGQLVGEGSSGRAATSGGSSQPARPRQT